jgi:hypothetical protein
MAFVAGLACPLARARRTADAHIDLTTIVLDVRRSPTAIVVRRGASTAVAASQLGQNSHRTDPNQKRRTPGPSGVTRSTRSPPTNEQERNTDEPRPSSAKREPRLPVASGMPLRAVHRCRDRRSVSTTSADVLRDRSAVSKPLDRVVNRRGERLQAADEHSGYDQDGNRRQPAHEREEPLLLPPGETVRKRRRCPPDGLAAHDTVFGRMSRQLEHESIGRRASAQSHRTVTYRRTRPTPARTGSPVAHRGRSGDRRSVDVGAMSRCNPGRCRSSRGNHRRGQTSRQRTGEGPQPRSPSSWWRRTRVRRLGCRGARRCVHAHPTIVRG